MTVMEAKSRLESTFAQRTWLWSEGGHSPKPSGTRSRHFHRLPSPRFWHVWPFLLAPVGWQWKRRLLLLCGASVAAVPWRVTPGAWEAEEFSPWVLLLGGCLSCTVFPGHRRKAGSFFTVPIACHSISQGQLSDLIVPHQQVNPVDPGLVCWHMAFSEPRAKRPPSRCRAEPCSLSLCSCRHRATRLGIQLCGK